MAFLPPYYIRNFSACGADAARAGGRALTPQSAGSFRTAARGRHSVSSRAGEARETSLSRTLRSLQRNILAGIITIGPLFVTWLIFSFLVGALAKAGLPVVRLLASIFPEEWLSEPWLQFILATVLTLAMLYVVGRVTSQVVGRQALGLFEAALDRLPVVAKIYSSVRQLIDSMMVKKDPARGWCWWTSPSPARSPSAS